MTVSEWDPRESEKQLSDELLTRLANFDCESNHSLLGLSEEEVHKLAPIVQVKADSWREICEPRDSKALVALCKWLTLADERLEGWAAGENSPVIVIAKLLRQREDYPPELTAWIRAHSSNRFLPYGSLLDRL